MKKTLDIVRFFQPDKWWIETPRYGLSPKQGFGAQISSWDVDYCQFSRDGFKKPTKFFGSPHLEKLQPRLCDGVTCPNLGVGKKHLRPLGGPSGGAQRKLTYPIPPQVVELACGLSKPERKFGKRVSFLLPPSSPSDMAPKGTKPGLRVVGNRHGDEDYSPHESFPAAEKIGRGPRTDAHQGTGLGPGANKRKSMLGHGTPGTCPHRVSKGKNFGAFFPHCYGRDL